MMHLFSQETNKDNTQKRNRSNKSIKNSKYPDKNLYINLSNQLKSKPFLKDKKLNRSFPIGDRIARDCNKSQNIVSILLFSNNLCMKAT